QYLLANGNRSLTGNLTPSVDGGSDIGTESKRFGAIHVDTIVEDFTPDADHFVGAGAKTIEGTAGESLSPGNLVYLKLSDGKWWKADADTEATSTGMLAIAVDTISADSTGTFLIEGVWRDDSLSFSTTGSSQPVFISTTAGAFTTTAPSGSGDIVRIIGWTLSATSLYFRPDAAWVEVS
ncbi:MAG: hypothetical protein ACTSPI_17790, partial [Candidatus Heimdallarchaeaceae archaeon]